MILPPVPTRSGGGVAFSDASDGDVRGDYVRRSDLARRLGISDRWATLTQVHGSNVLEVEGPGDQGEADAMFTSVTGLPLAIFTADCAGVVVVASGAIGVAHAGWRGAASGVVEALLIRMRSAGFDPAFASIGPALGPCCLEVGPEVRDRFDGFTARTSWGSESIDLYRAITSQLPGLDVWAANKCTLHEPGWFSHRRDRTPARMATIAWL
jgi:YfiH family protein